MESTAYAVEAEVEATHWWFVGRRALFAREIERLGLPPSARILDIGTSTGTNLRMLRELGFHHVTGLDFSPDAIRFCEQKGFGTVKQGDVCDMPFADQSFDLVLATDIIEHVDEDQKALAEIERVLRPGGSVLITVPTFRSLWGIQDELAHHKRRYRMGPLVDLVQAAGLDPQRQFYFNYVLFVPIWLARRLLMLTRPNIGSEAQLNSPMINRLLTGVFNLDVWTAPYLRLPFGVSAMVSAQKTIYESSPG